VQEEEKKCEKEIKKRERKIIGSEAEKTG